MILRNFLNFGQEPSNTNDYYTHKFEQHSSRLHVFLKGTNVLISALKCSVVFVQELPGASWQEVATQKRIVTRL